MTAYLPFLSLKAAKDRSANIAQTLGCGKLPEDVTKSWYRTVIHPVTGAVVLEVPDTDSTGRALLSVSEKLTLLPLATLTQAGWFPVPVVPVISVPPFILGMKLSSQWTWDNVLQPLAKFIGL